MHRIHLQAADTEPQISSRLPSALTDAQTQFCAVSVPVIEARLPVHRTTAGVLENVLFECGAIEGVTVQVCCHVATILVQALHEPGPVLSPPG